MFTRKKAGSLLTLPVYFDGALKMEFSGLEDLVIRMTTLIESGGRAKKVKEYLDVGEHFQCYPDKDYPG
jgi:hypothetical protein